MELWVWGDDGTSRVKALLRKVLTHHIINTIVYSIIYMRIAKSFTIESEVSEYVDHTKGEQSASERVNALLRRAMLQEKYERIEAEAKEFFAAVGEKERKETRAFQAGTVRTFTRD